VTLDQIISISRKVQSQDARGTLVTTLDSIAQCYARVRPLRGSERGQGNQVEATADYRFYIHYRSDLIEDDVIVWRGSQFNIRFIGDEGPGSIYLMIEAERGVAV
jgi:SPP1 family predicted phage head-tail adaptor